jgi:MFS transporter, FHS family, glucose/mannose:H+ symporter
MFVFGVVLAILGALFGLPEMHARIPIDLGQQGDIFLALFFGVFVSTLLTGPMIDSFGNKSVLTTSAVLVAIAFGALCFAHAFLPALISAAALGFGGGGLNTAANALVADLYPESRGAMLNVVGMFFGAGAAFIPLIATSIFSVVELLLIGAALSATAATAYALLTFPRPREPIGFSILASLRAAGMPGVLLFAIILLFESGNESSIGGWTSTYVGSLGATPRIATWVLAGYWAALMAGRLIAAKILKVLTPAQLVLASAIGSSIGCAMLLFAPSIALLAVGAVIIGLSFAAIYPTILAMAADRYQRLAGTIFGFLFAAGLIGGMFFPFAVGHISAHYGVRAGMAVPFGGAIGIAVLTIALMRRR